MCTVSLFLVVSYLNARFRIVSCLIARFRIVSCLIARFRISAPTVHFFLQAASPSACPAVRLRGAPLVAAAAAAANIASANPQRAKGIPNLPFTLRLLLLARLKRICRI